MTDLTPIKRGAVIDWKATAQAAHDLAEQRARIIAELEHQVADLDDNIGRVLEANRHQAAALQAIRAHWAAFLLPRELRE